MEQFTYEQTQVYLPELGIFQNEPTVTEENTVRNSGRSLIAMAKASYRNLVHAHVKEGRKIFRELPPETEFIYWYIENWYPLQNGAKLQPGRMIPRAWGFMLVPRYIDYYFFRSTSKSVGAHNSKVYGTWCAKAQVFQSGCKHPKTKYLGTFDTCEEAHQAWADFRTEQLHSVVLPYFLSDVDPEYRQHPMVVKLANKLAKHTIK